jgi:Uma2 family endonuclease
MAVRSRRRHAAETPAAPRRESLGVTEYWIVDPEVDRIHVYRHDGNSFGSAIELSREDTDVLTTALLPGLEMPLARIFRD